MSYARMDHADWLARHHASLNRWYSKRKGWKTRPETFTLFQQQVVDILGMVGGGIHNAPIAFKTAEWENNRVSVVWKRGYLSSFDDAPLTHLVFLCHEARIRCEVESAGPRMLRFSFWPRLAVGSTPERHPNLDEAVAAFREYFPSDHRITRPREVQP